jgi:ariadne-1
VKRKDALGVRCPECEEVMKKGDVEGIATKKILEKYVCSMYPTQLTFQTQGDKTESILTILRRRFTALTRHHKASVTPNWRWCLSPRCTSGQIHISKPSPPPPTKKSRFGKKWFGYEDEKSAPPIEDICKCNTCGAEACVPCDRPWHTGENCEEYQKRVKGRVEEEEASLKLIGKGTKKCPGCGKAIQKNGGCRSMICSQCRVNFCWDCLEVFVGMEPCGCTPGNPHHG